MRFVDVNILFRFWVFVESYETALYHNVDCTTVYETVNAKLPLCPCANNGILYRKLDNLSEGMVVSKGVYIHTTLRKRHCRHLLFVTVEQFFSALLSFQG